MRRELGEPLDAIPEHLAEKLACRVQLIDQCPVGSDDGIVVHGGSLVTVKQQRPLGHVAQHQ